MNNEPLQLGDLVADSVTGFRGVLMGRCEYLTGCNQYLITPTELDKDGNTREGKWFDDARVELLDSYLPDVAQRIGKVIGRNSLKPVVLAGGSPGADLPAPVK
jgi:hypothetical protein